MAAEYQKWVKIATEMGYEGVEMREFVRLRQEEYKEEKRLTVERDEKKRVEDIAREEKKQALEREDKLREADLKKIELERKSISEEREANLKKIELDNLKEIKMKELEVRMAHDKQQAERGDFVQDGVGREHTGPSDHTKNVKMPVFREDRDCLDAYLLRFERACTVYEVPEKFWAMTLARSLEGKALEVYQRLDIEQAHDYAKLKQELLRRFKLTEGGYRKLFKSARRQDDESVEQFMLRVQRYLRQWLLMAGFKDDYEGLESLILKDQFFVTCDDDMRCFLKEKGKLSLADTLTQAQNYVEAKESREKKWIPTFKKRDKDLRDHTRESDCEDIERHNGSPNKSKTREYRNPKERNHFKNEWDFRERKAVGENIENKKRGCYHCGSWLHYANKCDKVGQTAKVHTMATMFCEEEEEEDSEGLVVGIACFKHESVNRSSDEILNGKDNMSTVLVNRKTLRCLYDTGASCVAIRKGLEKPKPYTGRKVTCILANGIRKKYPTAWIDIQGEEFVGQAEALVIEDLVEELIVGPSLYEKVCVINRSDVETWDVGTNTDLDFETSNEEVGREETHKLVGNSHQAKTENNVRVNKPERNSRIQREREKIEEPVEEIFAMSVVQKHLGRNDRCEKKSRHPDARDGANYQTKDKFDKEIRYRANRWNWRKPEQRSSGVDRAKPDEARVRNRNGNDWRSSENEETYAFRKGNAQQEKSFRRGNGEARAFQMGNTQQRKPFRRENQKRSEKSSDGFWRRRENANYADVDCRVCREKSEQENFRSFGWKRSSGFDRWKGVPRCPREEQWWRKPRWV